MGRGCRAEQLGSANRPVLLQIYGSAPHAEPAYNGSRWMGAHVNGEHSAMQVLPMHSSQHCCQCTGSSRHGAAPPDGPGSAKDGSQKHLLGQALPARSERKKGWGRSPSRSSVGMLPEHQWYLCAPSHLVLLLEQQVSEGSRERRHGKELKAPSAVQKHGGPLCHISQTSLLPPCSAGTSRHPAPRPAAAELQEGDCTASQDGSVCRCPEGAAQLPVCFRCPRSRPRAPLAAALCTLP